MLVTVSEIRNYLQINTTDKKHTDANLSLYANTASSVIEGYCGRRFEAQDYVEYLDGGAASVFVTHTPVNNVSEVAVFNGTSYATQNVANVITANTDVVYDHEIGEFRKINNTVSPLNPVTFTDYRNGIKVSYNAGYVEVPADLKSAAMELIRLTLKGDLATTSESIGGSQKTNYSLSNNFPPHIKRVLDMYRYYG